MLEQREFEDSTWQHIPISIAGEANKKLMKDI